MNDEELHQKLHSLEQQISQISQQMEAIDQAMADMNFIFKGLDEIKEGKGKEVLAPLGRGIYVKAELKSKDLLVDIGNKNFVTKNVAETKELIEGQIKTFEGLRKELENEMRVLDGELTRTMQEHNKVHKH